MSAIFGIVYLNQKPVRQLELESMRNALLYRGKDGGGLWLHEYVGLGQLHNYYTPDSFYERLPFYDNEKKIAITADSRLDNRENLCQIFSIPPSEEDKIPDSALIVKAYEKWGEKCPFYLDGEFSFAIWDKGQNKLFCACDHLGYRPFFYYKNDNYFLFASEMKGIHSFPNFALQIDKEKFYHYLENKLSSIKKNPQETFFLGIKKLIGGCCLLLHQKQIKTSQYWQLEPKDTYFSLKEAEYPQLLRNIMINTIHKHLRTDFPVAIQLSGGLDSSSIACIAAQKLKEQGRELIVVSSVLRQNHNGKEYDEKEYISSITQQESNIRVRYVTSADFPLFSYLHRGFDCFENHIHHFNDMHFALLQAAQEEGARGILNGELGDMTVSFDGRNVYSQLITEREWRKIFDLFRYENMLSKISILRRQIFPHLISKKGKTTHGHAHSLIEKYNNGSFNVTHKKNIHAANFGMESLVPFGGRKLLEFIVSVPPEYFFYKGEKRALIKRAMQGILPEKIRMRKDKHIFFPDFYNQICKNKENIQKMFVTLSLEHPIWKFIQKDSFEEILENVAPVIKRGQENAPRQIHMIQDLIKIQFYLWLEEKKLI